ncbi:MAG: hypothetical protein SFZ23_16000 [Planctomycetota bacterium]|nr:hypothetical protein [Planctomycetota bacterium]
MNGGRVDSLSSWAASLRELAGRTLRDAEILDSESTPDTLASFVDTFEDEMGHRRAVDRPMLVRVLGPRLGSQAKRLLGESNPTSRPDESSGPELVLWRAAASRAIGLSPDVSEADAFGRALDRARAMARGEGLLATPDDVWGAIETRTESVLASLHAATWLGDGHRLDSQVRAAAEELLDVLQPDNGTQHPWAVHVFLALGEELASGTGADEPRAWRARHYAQTLVHNAIVNTGSPDRFSALVLLDAAAWLDEAGLRKGTGERTARQDAAQDKEG